MDDFYKDSHNRYEHVLNVCQSVITNELKIQKKFPDVQRISRLTGYTEERILESLEFGKGDDQNDRFHYSKRRYLRH
ncbi:hypothetical protein ACSVDE_01875 [Pseudalkalibacillus sp. Hm43]|uniref:hypothetical protein n=1 Tax=Pseudalkalibacillus sp. Hm43 TaxID=3450742 RepID=UPI003F421ADB